MELGASALQYQQTDNATTDIDALAFSDHSLDVTGLASITVEGVWVWFSINCHSCPAVCDDFDVGSCNVGVGFDKVCAENAGKELGRSDWVLLGFDVNSVFHRISSNNHAVVCFGVSEEG